MDYTIKINNTTVSIDPNTFSYVETKDRSLDFGKFTIPETNIKTRYTMLDDVHITISDGTNSIINDNFIIESDTVTPINKSHTLFKHEITIIERTKKLEYHVVGNRAMTQLETGTRKSLWDRINELRLTVPFEQTNNINTTRVFEIGTSLEFLKTIDAPDFFFNNKTLRETIDEIMDYANGVARLKPKYDVNNNIIYPYNILEIDLFNDTNTLQDKDTDLLGFQDNQTINEYATKIHVEASNQVNDFFTAGGVIFEPSETGFTNVRGDDGSFLQEDTFVKLNQPKFRQIRIQMRVPTVSLGTITIDITNNVVEQEVYDSLLTQPSTYVDFMKDLYKCNSLIWNQKDNKITNLYNLTNRTAVVEIENIENVIKTGIFRFLGGEQQTGSQQDATRDSADSQYVEQPYYEREFNVAYQPIFNSVSQVERVDGTLSNISKNTTKIANQGDNIISVGQTLDKMFSAIQQIGSAEYVTVKSTSNLNEIFVIGDFTSDRYICTKRELIGARNELTSKYEWTLNYQKVNGRIRIDSNPQLYTIPSGDEQVKRNEYYSEYLIASFDNLTPDATMLTDTGLDVFMNTIDATYQESLNLPILNVSYFSFGIVGTLQRIVKPIVSYGGGNSLNFYFEFESPNSAGEQIVLDNGDRVLQPVFYSNSNGEIDTFDLKYINDFTITDKDTLPLVPSANIGAALVDTTSFKLIKNSGEILAKTYAIHIIPDENYEDDIIIGERLIKRNNLVEINASKFANLQLISGSGRYNRFENKKGKSGHTPSSFSVFNNRVIAGTILNDSWAIVDDQNNLLLAVNQRQKDGTFVGRTGVYFVKKSKRGDIIETY